MSRDCALLGCGCRGTVLVSHPYRPESATLLCGYHAEYAEIVGAEYQQSDKIPILSQ